MKIKAWSAAKYHRKPITLDQNVTLATLSSRDHRQNLHGRRGNIPDIFNVQLVRDLGAHGAFCKRRFVRSRHATAGYAVSGANSTAAKHNCHNSYYRPVYCGRNRPTVSDAVGAQKAMRFIHCTPQSYSLVPGQLLSCDTWQCLTRQAHTALVAQVECLKRSDFEVRTGYHCLEILASYVWQKA